MRARRVAAFLGAAALVLGVIAAPAFAAGATLAQQEEEQPSPEETETETGEGGGAVEETGPPWTYQMSWLALIGSFFLLLAIGAAYYRFVVTRQRGEA